jgi:hypothetical protein
MEGLIFASESDLNMEYHHIKLHAYAQNLCTIVIHDKCGNKNTNSYPWFSRLSGS